VSRQTAVQSNVLVAALMFPPIRSDYTPHARAERLIAGARFVLAFFSFIAIYLEPSTPAKHQQTTYTLLLAYTVYALVIAGITWRAAVPSRSRRLASHAADLVIFSVFVSLTEGPASPFFLYFVFSLFCATLRFTWRGILATGVAAIAIYGTLAFVAAARDPDFEVSRVIVREAYLAVIAALLVYLGMYQQRLRLELTSLAAWPRVLVGRLDELLAATLAHAAAVLRTQRLLLIWEEPEEPWVYTAEWQGAHLSVQRVPPGTIEPFESPELRHASFFMRGPGDPILAYDPAQSTVREVAMMPAGALFLKRFGAGSILAVSLESETFSAYLVAPNVRSATADDLALAHVAGRLVLATLEQFFFLQQVRKTASAEERLRISRELHDGIVQSLGGVGLQLQAIRAHLPTASGVVDRLDHVQRVIEHDQRELRGIVRELRPYDTRSGSAILNEELLRVRERFALEWGLDVDLQMRTLVDVPAQLAQELCRIVNEALSNAVRHGGATRAAVRIERTGDAIEVAISDNGRGFAFSGRYDLAALEKSGSGPLTLRERVKALGGTIAVQSSSSGASVEARVPIALESQA
jgi:signal transduction histidine kinase